MKLFKLFILVSACLITSTLTAQWSEFPDSNTAVATLEGSQAVPKVATGPEGDVFIGFYSNETGNYDTRLQRYDQYGNQLWEDNGLLISDNPTMTWVTDWDMTVDQANNAILAWQDIRTGNNDIFVYSISENGEFNWGEDGLQLTDTPDFDASPKVCVTSENNVVVAWHGEAEVLMQKISPAGELLWGDTPLAIGGPNSYTWPQLLAVENDEIILKYFDDSGPPYAPTRHIYAQRFDTDGNPVWAEATAISVAGGISAWTQIFSIISDGADGLFIAWDDDRNMDMDEQAYVQHVDANGNTLFEDDGTEVATTGNRERFYPELAYDSTAETLTVYWRNTDSSQNNIGICGQKFDSTGNYLWGDDGLDIINISPTNVNIIGVSGSQFGVMIIYEEAHDAINSVVKAMLLDAEGDYVWAVQNVDLCSVESQKLHPDATGFADGQWVAVWEDTRDDSGDIYAQNVSITGELGPVQDYVGIAGHVFIAGGEGNVEDVVISTGTETTNPAADGGYILILDPGVYDISASLTGYNTVTAESVEVQETGLQIVNFLMELEDFDPPYNVQIDDMTGIFTWEHPYVTGEEAEAGFELEELPGGWLNIDADGDSLSWFLYTYNPHGGSQSIASASWISPLGPLNPDNWLISPALDIGTDSELHFWYAAQDENFPYENFGLFLSTNGTDLTDFTENIFETTVESTDWTEVVIDLSQYLSETIYLAWRHYDCTDQFYLKIDDISLVNAVTRERVLLADFENGLSRDNIISTTASRFRDVESYNVYLDDELIANTSDLTYTFEGLINGQSYAAGVTAVYTFGESEPVELNFTYAGTDATDDLIEPASYLIGNYPNPFNPVTTISFVTTEDTEDTELTVYNAKGQRVKSFKADSFTAQDAQLGMYSVVWNGTDENEKSVTSGVYFYKLQTASKSDIKKMILLR